jgi:hypothetical protein
MTWIQIRSGKAFDLVTPDADKVDFTDIGFARAHQPLHGPCRID